MFDQMVGQMFTTAPRICATLKALRTLTPAYRPARLARTNVSPVRGRFRAGLPCHTVSKCISNAQSKKIPDSVRWRSFCTRHTNRPQTGGHFSQRPLWPVPSPRRAHAPLTHSYNALHVCHHLLKCVHDNSTHLSPNNVLTYWLAGVRADCL